MKPLYSNDEFNKARTIDKLPVECYQCGNTFYKLKRVITRTKYNLHYTGKYCSSNCMKIYKTTALTVECKQCKQIFTKKLSECKKSPNHFCTSSCAATWNNTHKTKGTRRSKLEIWLEEKLTILYPNLNIMYCDKTSINSELDIYIPSIQLAIELNGIYHYEPIHGNLKFKQIQNNDKQKIQACIEHNIELHIIDTSSLKYFNERNCQKYLDNIQDIIDSKLNLAS